MARPVALDQPRMEAQATAFGHQLRAGDVLLLDGPLGGGKTTFVRALAKGMRVHRPDRVCSPTYTLCMVHEGPIALIHVDLFRLGERAGGRLLTAGFESLGLDDHEFPDDRCVLAVEWAELWAEPPAGHLRLSFARDPLSEGSSRTIVAVGSGARGEILATAWASLLDQKT